MYNYKFQDKKFVYLKETRINCACLEVVSSGGAVGGSRMSDAMFGAVREFALLLIFNFRNGQELMTQHIDTCPRAMCEETGLGWYSNISYNMTTLTCLI